MRLASHVLHVKNVVFKEQVFVVWIDLAIETCILLEIDLQIDICLLVKLDLLSQTCTARPRNYCYSFLSVFFLSHIVCFSSHGF